MDATPVWLSIQVSLLATALTLAAGVPAAWLLARKATLLKDVLGGIVVAPLVLPPTVLGYYLLTLIGAGGPVGRLLESAGIQVAFTWRAAVLAAALGSIPLLIKTVQAGFESVDARLEQAARTLGRSEWSVFWSVTLPLSWRAVVAGTVLAFCRAFGDFGITLMVAGSIPGRTQTLPLAIYDLVQADRMHEANVLAALTVAAVIVLLVGFARVARLRY